MFTEKAKANLRTRIRAIFPDIDNFLLGIICDLLAEEAIENIQVDPTRIENYIERVKQRYNTAP